MIASIREENKEEGKIEGRIEGERNKAISIAKKLLKMKLKKEYIIEAAGLKEMELEKLV